MDTKFEYKTVDVGNIGLEIVDYNAREASLENLQIIHGGRMIKSIIIDGERITPTGRFWESLYSKFGLNRSFFKFFDYLEVFKRISEKTEGEPLRVCLERKKDDIKALAVTGLNKPVIVYDDLVDILGSFEMPEGIKYHNGIISSTHSPIRGGEDFKIGGEKFSNRFVMHTPIDGYGQPNIYLSLLRWVCSNGAVGFANSFKTSLALGHGSDSIHFTIRRALESFANEEGYSSLRDRLQTSMHSWASIKEHLSLYDLLLRIQGDSVLKEKAKDFDRIDQEDLKVSVANALLKSYNGVTGNPFDMYRISDPNLLGVRKQRTLPVGCKVYDLINFATELSSHYVNEHNARQLQAWVGEMLANDFDLEESCDQFSDWQDTFLKSPKS